MFHYGSGGGNPTPPMQYHPPGRQFYQQPQSNYLPTPWLQYSPAFLSSPLPGSSMSMPGHSRSPKAITPNTAKSIHQAILQSLGEDPEDEEHVLGSQQHSGSFVPPLPVPSYNLNFRQKMINRWQEETANFRQGGEMMERCWPQAEMTPANFVPEKPTSKSSNKPAKQIRKGPPQKRSQKKSTSTDPKNEKVTDEDDATNRIQRRREMNKMAAARCRKRRADRTTELQDEVKQWEAEQLAIRMEIMELQAIQEKLKSVLGNHECIKDNVRSKPNSRNKYLVNQGNPPTRSRQNQVSYHQGPPKVLNMFNMRVREV